MPTIPSNAPNDNQLLEEIRQMTLKTLHKLTREVGERALFMDPTSPDYMEDFKFVWGYTRETMKVIPGLEPKQEAGPQLVIDVRDLPGIAEALQKPAVSALPMAEVVDMPSTMDAPEPRFGASDQSVEDVVPHPPRSTSQPEDDWDAEGLLSSLVDPAVAMAAKTEDEIKQLLGDFE